MPPKLTNAEISRTKLWLGLTTALESEEFPEVGQSQDNQMRFRPRELALWASLVSIASMLVCLVYDPQGYVGGSRISLGANNGISVQRH
ncbi:hypothetical protein RRG08_058605 [Elysia crispata]|uniref:Uncharacterized protein n=1 Tax=Elysia crispata TaxID=231223 RepID=A0AAE1DNH2_9GAST|nr:hypothetical protein RRG08_058605 [Elysia crispata]